MSSFSDSAVTALLAQEPLFRGLEADALARIAQGTRELHVAKGQIIFHRGDFPSGFHLVEHGQVKLAISSPQGGEKVVDVLEAGQVFGVAMMFLGKPYVTYAQTLKDSRLLHISKVVVADEMERNPSLVRVIINALSMRLFNLITDVESYSLHSGCQRVIGYLLATVGEREQGALTVELPTSKGVIASRLNLTQEHFSRILRELLAAGLIVVDGRKVSIPSIARLRAYEI